ncbi:hypothetical protein RHS01_08734 [Rhizoctonia solani]|uniref:Uncharacterized protein n=1 Tax=Rhizoctonia solani TaxID=456999 RepID=A0A8H7I7V7_9AGAM|nr:hypothetical protein RHS01_08734 [Rhizoctonia solani]
MFRRRDRGACRPFELEAVLEHEAKGKGHDFGVGQGLAGGAESVEGYTAESLGAVCKGASVEGDYTEISMVRW